MTVGQIDAMPHEEFAGWAEYEQLEGALTVGLRHLDRMHAQGVSVLAEINRDREKRSEPFTARDFLLWPQPEPPREEPMVEGKTASQWKLIFAAERLARRREL